MKRLHEDSPIFPPEIVRQILVRAPHLGLTCIGYLRILIESADEVGKHLSLLIDGEPFTVERLNTDRYLEFHTRDSQVDSDVTEHTIKLYRTYYDRILLTAVYHSRIADDSSNLQSLGEYDLQKVSIKVSLRNNDKHSCVGVTFRWNHGNWVAKFTLENTALINQTALNFCNYIDKIADSIISSATFGLFLNPPEPDGEYNRDLEYNLKYSPFIHALKFRRLLKEMQSEYRAMYQ